MNLELLENGRVDLERRVRFDGVCRGRKVNVELKDM